MAFVVLLAAQPALAAGVGAGHGAATATQLSPSAADPADAPGVDTGPESTAEPDTGPVQASAGESATGTQRQTSGAAPPDPDSDVLGWENGYWYNESIDATQSDGLNDSEMDAVVGRAMARVEQIRRIEFERTPPVKVVSRSEFRRNTKQRFQQSNVSQANRLHQNVKFEALFLVGEETDYLAVNQQNTAAGVLGFYVSGNGSNLPGVTGGDIVIVSNNESTPKIDEITLSQELFHALQDQQLNTTGAYNVTTEEDRHAVLGVIEGDGNYVDYLYEQRCNAEWDCLRPSKGEGGGAGDRHIGLVLYQLIPYSEGPPFVQGIHDRGGWEAVNRLYADPPASTEQLIHPGAYNEDPPQTVRVEDTSSGDWRVLELSHGVNYASFGEGGAFVMLWYPSYQTRSDQVIPLDIFGASPPGLYDYDHPYSAGWDGDRLVPYVTNDSASTNETAYVWKLAWDTPGDAREFAEGYRKLLAFHGADRVGKNTYVVPEGRTEKYGGEFGDAFHVIVENDTVTVVNAPTRDDLQSVHDGVSIQPVPEDSTPVSVSSGSGDSGSGGSTDPSGIVEPGFGVAVAVLALLASAFVIRSRR